MIVALLIPFLSANPKYVAAFKLHKLMLKKLIYGWVSSPPYSMSRPRPSRRIPGSGCSVLSRSCSLYMPNVPSCPFWGGTTGYPIHPVYLLLQGGGWPSVQYSTTQTLRATGTLSNRANDMFVRLGANFHFENRSGINFGRMVADQFQAVNL